MKLFSILLSVVMSSVAVAASEGMLENRKPSPGEPAVCLLSVGVKHKLSGKEQTLTDKLGYSFLYKGVVLVKHDGTGSRFIACGERAYPSESRKFGPIEKSVN